MTLIWTNLSDQKIYFSDPDPQIQILSKVITVESYKNYNREAKNNDEETREFFFEYLDCFQRLLELIRCKK